MFWRNRKKTNLWFFFIKKSKRSFQVSNFNSLVMCNMMTPLLLIALGLPFHGLQQIIMISLNYHVGFWMDLSESLPIYSFYLKMGWGGVWWGGRVTTCSNLLKYAINVHILQLILIKITILNNEQVKTTNNDWSHTKLREWHTQTPEHTRGKIRCSGGVSILC